MTRWRRVLLPLCAWCAAPGMPQASSAFGIDAQVGSALNPSGGTVLCTPHPDGLQLFGTASRTPGGFLVDTPCLAPEHDPNGDGWIVYGTLEAGVLGSGGDTANAHFVEYADRGSGAVLSVLSLVAAEPGTGRYAEFDGGELGRDDAWFAARFGRAGSYRVEAGYNRIRHVTAHPVRTPYDGAGSDRLTLPAAFPPGSVQADDGDGSASALAAYTAARPARSLAVERERFSAAGEVALGSRARLFADYRHERRDGTKASAGSFMFDFVGVGGVNELLQPIDYTSDDLTLGVAIDSARYALNATYSGSFFRNGIDTLTYDNPWQTGFGYVPTRGETDLYPDNAYHRVAVEGRLELPWWHGAASAVLARGRMTQDDDLVPFTRNSGTVAGIDLADWNTLAALERTSAEARIDTSLALLRLVLAPTERLAARLQLRRYAEQNRTPPFSACNALTGQCAFVLLDGGFAGLTGSPERFALFDPEQGVYANFRYRSVPWDSTRTQATLGLDYRLAARTTLGLDLERERVARRYREVDATHEERVTLRLVQRAGAWGTLRVAAGLAERDYDGAYVAQPYRAFYTESLLSAYIADPATAPADAAAAQAALDAMPPHTLAELRKSDLAARTRATLAVKWNLAVDARSDLLLSLDLGDDDYDAAYGLGEASSLAAGIEFSRAPGAAPGWHVGYHFQARKSAQANIDDAGFGSDPAAGGSLYPLAAAWSADEDERSHFVTLGARFALPARLRLGLDYVYGMTTTAVGYRSAAARGRFDDLRYRRQALTANLRGTLGETLAWRLFVQHERGTLEDFHDTGPGHVVDGMLLLGSAVGDWRATTVGLFAEYRF